jgi:hypothetical protein
VARSVRGRCDSSLGLRQARAAGAASDRYLVAGSTAESYRSPTQMLRSVERIPLGASSHGRFPSERRAVILRRMEQYDIRLRGRSSKGKQLIRDYGSVWTVVGTNGPNVLIASPPTMPTFWRILMESGDPNFFDVERLETSRDT